MQGGWICGRSFPMQRIIEYSPPPPPPPTQEIILLPINKSP